MKQRVSDYIADFLYQNNIKHIFLVAGGGAMFLDDALGHHPNLHCIFNHHEQASAMAAEAYARVNNQIAGICVTTGPGATNAITGVAGAWMDSIPMLVLSGQARYETTVYASKQNLRTRGIQEFDILGSVTNMTKYAAIITRPEMIRYHLEKALYYATEGRPGPIWLDIPLDIQGAMIDTNQLIGFQSDFQDYAIEDIKVDLLVEKIKNVQKPLIFVGNGVRLAGASQLFRNLVDQTGIPVVTGMSSIDAIETDHPLFVGRNGTTGDRAGNFAIQNCDLLLSLGSRQSFFQTGFNFKEWAPKAFKAINDIDANEVEKDSICADLELVGDVKNLLEKLLVKCDGINKESFNEWVKTCRKWKKKYPVVQEKHYKSEKVNIYAFFKELTQRLDSNTDICVSVGTSRVAGSQASIIKKGQRFFTNPSMAAMGYDLPAAIGVCIANGKKPLVLITGDGSFQMNIQELQTIKHLKLPILIFVMNNQGYHSIRMTQKTYFEEPLIGIGPDSGDLSFPDLSQLIPAYGISYASIKTMKNLNEGLNEILSLERPCICEVFLTPDQITEPKVASQKLPNGQMVSATLDNMAPFLDYDASK